MNTIKLRRQLNVFAEADTSSELLGTVDEGSYELSEIKKNYPNDETDFMILKEMVMQLTKGPL